MLMSGCGQASIDREREALGQAEEKMPEMETETEKVPEIGTEKENMETEAAEETENQSEPTVTICTGIDSKIIEKDSSFAHIEWLDSYLDESAFSLIKMDCPAVYPMEPCLFREDESEGWTEDDWDLVRSLGQISNSSMGYGKIDYDNDGEEEYIYRAVENEMTAIEYTVSGDGKEITGEYDLVNFFARFYGEEKLLRQLWFKDVGDTAVSLCLVENSPKSFTVSALLVEGDSARVLEKRKWDVRTIEVPEGEKEDYREKDLFASQSWILDFVGEDYRAYDLTREELKNLRQGREIKMAEQETGLPETLVDILQNLMIGWQRDEEISADDALEPYEAKDCRLEDDYVLDLLRDSDSFLEGVMDAYRADLDGDGKEEIIMRAEYGGNGRGKPIEILRQSEDAAGKYVREEIGWDSNAMLLLIDGNYYYVASIYSDFLASLVWEVFSFSEDKRVKVDEIAMEPQGTGMSWMKLYENDGIKPEILDRIQSYIESRKEEMEGEEILWGNAEQFSEYTTDCRAVDVDNDGEMETCYKERLTLGIGPPGWLYTVISEKYGIALREIEFDLAEEFFKVNIERYMWQLWFEEFDGKNYIFCMEKLDGSLDAFLGVYLIQERKLYPVMNYLLLDKKVFRCGAKKDDAY